MSQLEETLLLHLRAAGLPEPEREVVFAKPRRWRFDFCWPGRMLAVEVHGGTWVSGRHSRGAGMAADFEKENTAQLLGWKVLKFTSGQVSTGAALATIEAALKR